jgi:hypothetical protein
MKMKISDYPEYEDLNDIETLSITIKAVPFEGIYVPAFVITSPDDDYTITLDEVNCLMDGVEIAQRKIDDIINFILKSKVFNDKEDDDVDGESDS